MRTRRQLEADTSVASNAVVVSSYVNVGLFLVLYVCISTAVPIYLHIQHHHTFNVPQALLSFFLPLNVLICIWEISLGLNIVHIKGHFEALRKEYKQPWGAVMALFLEPLTLAKMFSLRFWSRIWSTYSLYDPSYSNRESYGFFVDVSNGWTTLLPSLLYLYCMSATQYFLSARFIGVVGLIKFYTEFHGTCVYFLSFFFNSRHVGKGVVEVALFVGLSNGLWFFFPLLGLWCSYQLVLNDNYSVFGR